MTAILDYNVHLSFCTVIYTISMIQNVTSFVPENSSVFIAYGHADAVSNHRYKFKSTTTTVAEEVPSQGEGETTHKYATSCTAEPTILVVEAAKGDVLFVPNEKATDRIDDEYLHAEAPRVRDGVLEAQKVLSRPKDAARKHRFKPVPRSNEDVTSKERNSDDAKSREKHEEVSSRQTYDDLMNRRSISDILKKKPGNSDLETTKSDILFIVGKNDDSLEEKEAKERKVGLRHDDSIAWVKRKPATNAPAVLDCEHLDCNNTVQSICATRMDDSKLKYRLFRNECFLRKVNCEFKYDVNRYKVVSGERCRHIGGHYTNPPYVYQPVYKPVLVRRQGENPIQGKSGRRASYMNMEGRFCAHACPTACTDDYAPECALGDAGERRVFANHCQLDLNSCSFGLVWRRRPLSECVGGKKAEVQQNRAFIGWMQRVGIVDGKGRLQELH